MCKYVGDNICAGTKQNFTLDFFFSLDISIYWEMSYCEYQCFSFFLFCVGPFIGSLSDYDIVKGKNNKLAEACQKDTLNVKYSANNFLYKYTVFLLYCVEWLKTQLLKNLSKQGEIGMGIFDADVCIRYFPFILYILRNEYWL